MEAFQAHQSQGHCYCSFCLAASVSGHSACSCCNSRTWEAKLGPNWRTGNSHPVGWHSVSKGVILVAGELSPIFSWILCAKITACQQDGPAYAMVVCLSWARTTAFHAWHYKSDQNPVARKGTGVILYFGLLWARCLG